MSSEQFSTDPTPDPVAPRNPLAEVDDLISELQEKVAALATVELDAATLETKLREINEIASRAASTLESATR